MISRKNLLIFYYKNNDRKIKTVTAIQAHKNVEAKKIFVNEQDETELISNIPLLHSFAFCSS